MNSTWYQLRSAADLGHPLVAARSRSKPFITQLNDSPELAAAIEALGSGDLSKKEHAERTPVERFVFTYRPGQFDGEAPSDAVQSDDDSSSSEGSSDDDSSSEPPDPEPETPTGRRGRSTTTPSTGG